MDLRRNDTAETADAGTTLQRPPCGPRGHSGKECLGTDTVRV